MPKPLRAIRPYRLARLGSLVLAVNNGQLLGVDAVGLAPVPLGLDQEEQTRPAQAELAIRLSQPAARQFSCQAVERTSHVG
jgi:hypothetical protein